MNGNLSDVVGCILQALPLGMALVACSAGTLLVGLAAVLLQLAFTAAPLDPAVFTTGMHNTPPLGLASAHAAASGRA